MLTNIKTYYKMLETTQNNAINQSEPRGFHVSLYSVMQLELVIIIRWKLPISSNVLEVANFLEFTSFGRSYY